MYATSIEFIYLISFNAVTGNIITNTFDMVKTIKAINKYGIAFIKVYDPIKEKFVHLSKANLKAQVDFNTELLILLESLHYL